MRRISYSRQPTVTREEALTLRAYSRSEPANNNRGHSLPLLSTASSWPKEVAGHVPKAEDAWFADYCPLRKVTRAYPPTMLVLGTADTHVPCERSKLMADRLQQAGVQHQLITVPEGGHGIGNIAAAEQDRLYRDAASFLMDGV